MPTTRSIDPAGLAQDFTFGVEIETTVSLATVEKSNMTIGEYHRDIQIPFLPQGWLAMKDASINAPTGRTGCEIVSPVLKGAVGIAELIHVVRILNQHGFKVNDSCGVHVHVGFADRTAEDLAKLITLTALVEKGLYASTGTKKRERSSWCKSVKKHGAGTAKMKSKEFVTKYKAETSNVKYQALNINNLNPGGKGTVEFRVFSGSLNATKIVGWVQACLGLVEKSLTVKKMPQWNGKEITANSRFRKGGEGATELERLLFILGWGDRKKNYGWISDAIPMKEIKKEFRRLAKKYDSE